jgi:hypothetical protein
MNLKKIEYLLAFFVMGLLWMFNLSPVVQAGGPWYVSPTGNNSNNCLSVSTACKTIAAAIGKASNGDTIIVAGGTYIENIIY